MASQRARIRCFKEKAGVIYAAAIGGLCSLGTETQLLDLFIFFNFFIFF